MGRRREYDDDDGRVIAPMDIDGMPHTIARERRAPAQSSQQQGSAPLELTRAEKWSVCLGALKAALLIALVFIVGLGLAILLMIYLWS